jgi:hypothetical protein
MMNWPKGTRLLAGILGVGVWASAASSPLFDDDSVLEVSLAGPFGVLFEDKEANAYRPFTLVVQGQRHEISVRVRGHSRRRVCEFPPLKLDFSPEGPEATVFEGQGKLKLVTHCRNHDRGEQDMLEEYLAYRIFGALSGDSFKVRLLRLSYRDSERRLPDDASPRYGFLIEPSETLAARLGVAAVALPGVPVNRHNLEQAALVYLFQYLIGNTDWSLVRAEREEDCCHNIELFERDGQVFFVPYDFDLAGIVNARYAFPDRSLSIRRVTQRLYRGYCTDRDILRRAILAVNEQRTAILSLLGSTPGLQPGSVKTAAKYLEAYFERAGEVDRLLDEFERRCLGH